MERYDGGGGAEVELLLLLPVVDVVLASVRDRLALVYCLDVAAIVKWERGGRGGVVARIW